MKKSILLILLFAFLFTAHTAKADVLFPRGAMPTSAAADSEDSGLTLRFMDKSITVDTETINSWRGSGELQNYFYTSANSAPRSVADLYAGGEDLNEIITPDTISIADYNPSAIYQFIKSQTAGFATQAQEPAMEIQNGKVVNFTPPQNGYTPNLYSSTTATIAALRSHATSTDLAVATTTPLMQLSQTNTLGIDELIAEGVSNFKGSPSNRRHNIKIGVQKMAGVVIAPGEEFSFNKFLGPVDGPHGFLPELVIKREGTVPEFGGGLCQVSSTTFRAAMAAGFPITQRRNHAYAVQYYAPQGTDATIYPGVIDLKFINDSPGSILIWPYEKDDNILVFDFYGTKDDRQVTLEKPEQYDRKPDGSMKATWTREVTKAGETKTDVFKSVYASPALYHKTETFPTTTPATGIHVGT